MTPILTLTPRTRLADRDLHVLHAFDRAAPLHLRALLGAVRRCRPDDRDGAGELAAWAERTGIVVRRHHAVVRSTLGPLLVAADPLSANLVGALSAGHRLVAEAFAEVEEALHTWAEVAGRPAVEVAEPAHGRSVAAVERAVVAVDEQVRREQVTFEPALVAAVAPAAFDEVRGELALHADPELLPFLFPWLARGCDEREEERLVAQLPRTMRLVHRFVWTPSHAQTYPRLAAAGRSVDRGLVEPAAA